MSARVITVSCKLSPEEYTVLQAIARSRQTSTSQLLRQSLEEQLHLSEQAQQLVAEIADRFKDRVKEE